MNAGRAHGIDAAPVVCVRGPSRSGKTSVCERLIEALAQHNLRCAYIKRTHHSLDLPEKSSGRIWARQPASMLLVAPDRSQLTQPFETADATALVRSVPDGTDLVLLESHSPEPYPTILSTLTDPVAGEQVIGRWHVETIDRDVAAALPAVQQLLPEDPALTHALRLAAKFHGGHACAGLVLGTRLALHGAGLLGLEVPDRSKRLLVHVETGRCAADALQAVTGCRVGRRTLRILDYGKLAATFFDTRGGVALRVAVRGDLRRRVDALALQGESRDETQRRMYLTLPPGDIFSTSSVAYHLSPFDEPGRPQRRVECVVCGEEVSDGRDVATDAGPLCRPCFNAANYLKEGAPQ